VQGRGRASCSAPRARPDWGHADAARPGGHEACIASRRGRPEGGVPAVRNARRSVRPQRVGDHPPTAPRWARSEARDGAGDWPPRGSRAAARVSALPSWLRTSPRPPPARGSSSSPPPSSRSRWTRGEITMRVVGEHEDLRFAIW